MAERIGRRNLLAAALAGVVARPAFADMPGAILRFIPESGLAGADPIAQPSIAGRAHAMLVWDQLYGQGMDSSQEPTPQMVEGHERSEDGRFWRFTLREGLLFHDETPVRAADCVASIRRWGARRPFGQELLARTSDLRAVSERVFEIVLTRPFPLMLTALATDTCFIMPQAEAETDAATPISRIMGSGPFRFLPAEFVPGSRAAYARFDRYLPAPGAPDFTAGAKQALVARVEWTAMDPTAALAALASGAVDWWENPPPDLHEAIAQTAGVRLQVNQAAGVMPVLLFNHAVPPFNNARLLRALLPAFDQLEFMTASMASTPSLYETGVGIFTPGSPSASDVGLEVLTTARDLEAARKDVQESGYAGETVTLMSPTDVPRLQALTEVASDLFQRVGLIVEVAEMDWATLLQRRARREAPEQGGWSGFCTTFPAFALTSPAMHPLLRDGAEQRWPGSAPGAPLEALREAWFDAGSARKRLRLCEQMQVSALHEVNFLPLGEWYGVAAVRDGVRGVQSTPYPVFFGVAPAAN